MKIAVLAHSFPRFPGDSHGPFVKHLSEALAGRGHDVHVLVPYDPAIETDPESPLHVESFRYVWPDSWHLLGYSRTLARDRRLKPWAYLQAPLYFRAAERSLRELVESEGVEAIHAHWLLPNGYVGGRVSRRTGVPLGITMHGSDVLMAEANPLFAKLATTAVRAASHVTSCSPELRDRLVAVAGAEAGEKTVLVPNGTRLSAANAADRCERDEGKRTVVAVGRLVDKKGFEHLVAATPAIAERHPGVEVVIGGGGELRGELERRAERLGVSHRVRFPGALSHEEALELVSCADVFVMPSVRDDRGNVDGLPIVVLEAMAAARPVVASEISGIPLAIDDGETGVLVPPGDPTALAEAVGDLLGDPERAERLGRAARRRVETELNWDAVACRHEELFAAAAT